MNLNSHILSVDESPGMLTRLRPPKRPPLSDQAYGKSLRALIHLVLRPVDSAKIVDDWEKALVPSDEVLPAVIIPGCCNVLDLCFALSLLSRVYLEDASYNN